MYDVEAPVWLGEIPALPGPTQGRPCGGCGWILPLAAFGRSEALCKVCVGLFGAATADPEERAKRVLLQRAKKHTLSWELFRELRAEKRCAEWLADHPTTGRSAYFRYGYVYVLQDADDKVLYVGKAQDVETRLFIQTVAHRFNKEWFDQVATVTVYTYWARDYDEGERWKIQELNPIHNKVRPKPRRTEAPTPLSEVRGSIDGYR